MKRGKKFFLVDQNNEPAGPFSWTHVREWFAIGLLGPKSLVCQDGADSWREISEFHELCSLPPSLASPTSDLSVFLQRERKPLCTQRRSLLERAGNPFPVELVDDDLALRIAKRLSADFPGRVDGDLRVAEEPHDWREAGASDAQLVFICALTDDLLPRYLPGTATWAQLLLIRDMAENPLSLGRHEGLAEKQLEFIRDWEENCRMSLTKGEASDLIDFLKAVQDPPTEGQIRRLSFYGIAVSDLSKHSAMERIDAFKTSHPESEQKYQRWKAENGL